MVFDVLGHFLVSVYRWLVTFDHKALTRNALRLSAYVVATFATAAFAAEETFDLSVRLTTSSARGVKAIVEVSGHLKLNDDGSQISELPLRGRGELAYTELTLTKGKRVRKDIRLYQAARATIRIGDTRLENGLDEARRLVLAHVEDSRQTLFSPQGLLTSDELQLIDLQGSTALSHLLAPSAPVAIGGEWKHEPDFLSAFLGLDAIAQAEVKSTLRKVEGEIAIVDMSGTVTGAIDGISSDIVIKAKYNIDIKRHSLVWMAMSIREDRAIGHASPGFEVVARLRIAATDQPTPRDLAPDALVGLPLDSHKGSSLLSLVSAGGGFSLLHARNWQVMVERADVTVLRLVQQGELIAQCNVSSLPDSASGGLASLSAFRTDIEKALGKNFGEFVEASQRTNDKGLRILRAVVSGVASELPIQWIYYHVSNDQGRQAALVFTMDSKGVEKFAGADEALLSSFEFAEKSLPAGDPTPASIDKPAIDASVR